MAEHTSEGRRSALDVLRPDDSACTEKTHDQNLWSRSLARKWIPMLFMGSSLLYCSRMAMPICAVTMAAVFHWTKIDSGMVLGGFFWGYCLTQILGGHASDKMGGERVLLVSAVLWALITAATPLLARLGSHTVFLMSTARFLMGLFQGVFFPSLASLCSQRVVEGERGFLMSTMHSGTLLGTLLAGGLGSLLLDRYGWESVFYCVGAMSGVWVLLVWQCLIKDECTPKQIESSNDSLWKMSRTWWLTLFKKPPVWAMVFAHMCICSTGYTLLSWLPTYFKESFPNSTGWIYNIIPWLTAIPSALLGGYVSDFLISQGYSVEHVRKFMQCLSFTLPPPLLSFSECGHGCVEPFYYAPVWYCQVSLCCDFHICRYWGDYLFQWWCVCECSGSGAVVCRYPLRFYEYDGCSHGGGDGVFVGLPDRGDVDVGHGLLPPHLS